MGMKKRKEKIIELLNEKFSPLFLEVEDESHKHHRGPNAESHFAVHIVSDLFNDLSLIAKHRLVNESLKEIFNEGLHALAIKAIEPKKWNKNTDFKTPDCLHFNKEKIKGE